MKYVGPFAELKAKKLLLATQLSNELLADGGLSQYAVGLRADVVLESSRHAGWSTDSTYYRAVLRVEGMGTWRAVLTPKAGSTRSWGVTLEAR